MEFPMMDQGIEESMCNKVVYSVKTKYPKPILTRNFKWQTKGL